MSAMIGGRRQLQNLQHAAGKWLLIILYPAKLSLKNERKHTGLWEQMGIAFLIGRSEIKEDFTKVVLFEFSRW